MKIYLLGGVPRSGKTQTASYILKNKGISFISTDLLRKVLGRTFPHLGLVYEDGVQKEEEKSKIIWPFIKEIINSSRGFDGALLIEGTNLLPELVAEVKDIEDVRICFLGFPNVDENSKFKQIREFEKQCKANGWTEKYSDEQLKDLIKYLKEESQKLKESCKVNKVMYFDISNGFVSITKKVDIFFTKSE